MKQQSLENFVIGIFFALLVVGSFIDLGPVCMRSWVPTIGVCE